MRRLHGFYYKYFDENCHTHSGFLDLSQLSRASLLKAAVAALLLLLRWIFAMVSEFFTTSMRPILFPVDKQPYGIILGVGRQ